MEGSGLPTWTEVAGDGDGAMAQAVVQGHGDSEWVAALSVILPIAYTYILSLLLVYSTLVFTTGSRLQRASVPVIPVLSLLPSADRTSEQPTATVCSTLSTSASDGFTS
jgi:hypothetical protein